MASVFDQEQRSLMLFGICPLRHEGDVLQAKADAYPPANFSWIQPSTDEVLSTSPTLRVTNEMTNDLVLEVRAYNDFRNATHSVSMKVLVARSMSCPLGGESGSLLIVILLRINKAHR